VKGKIGKDKMNPGVRLGTKGMLPHIWFSVFQQTEQKGKWDLFQCTHQLKTNHGLGTKEKGY